jgi:hypothetical protein
MSAGDCPYCTRPGGKHIEGCPEIERLKLVAAIKGHLEQGYPLDTFDNVDCGCRFGRDGE